jgi:sodium transport system ATP-binding protein
VIRAEGLAKRFGEVVAVDGVSFVARDGCVTGLLGPNGAGKTTTLRMISTLVEPTQGTASVDARDVRREPVAARARLGMLSDARPSLAASIARLAEWLDLTALLDRRTEGFSNGERMKVAIARALVHDPQNVVLDEPTNGLDVMTTRSLREVIRRLRGEGKCVLFSSHVMQEVSALCDDILIIARGAVVASGTPAELLAASGRESLEDAFVALAGITHPS